MGLRLFLNKVQGSDRGRGRRYKDLQKRIVKTGSKVINLFVLNSSEHKISMLINVKMQTIVGILSFIRLINTTSECLKPNKSLFFSNIVFVSS